MLKDNRGTFSGHCPLISGPDASSGSPGLFSLFDNSQLHYHRSYALDLRTRGLTPLFQAHISLNCVTSISMDADDRRLETVVAMRGERLLGSSESPVSRHGEQSGRSSAA